MADKPQSLSERKAAAGLPTRTKTQELAKMGRLTYLSAEPTQARNPQTGEMGPGYLVVVQDSDGRKFQAFMGGTVLARDLQAMIDSNGFPFTATLQRDGEGQGHPWIFGD